jgi:hypothetical protein
MLRRHHHLRPRPRAPRAHLSTLWGTEMLGAAAACAEQAAAAAATLAAPLPPPAAHLAAAHLAAALLLALPQQHDGPSCTLWHAYCQALARWPLATRVAMGVVGAGLSDGLAQLLELRSGAPAGGRQGQPPGPRGGGGGAAAPGAPSPSAAGRQQQQQRRRQRGYSAARTARLALYSAAVGTPVACAWFWLLDVVRGGGAGCLQQL